MADEPRTNGTDTYLTVREIVMEIRQDVKDLQAQAQQMQAAREHVIQLDAVVTNDHESRLRTLEAWKYGIPFSGIVAIAAALAAVLGSN